MSKLPVVNGRQIVAFMQSHGYSVVRQRGSHIRLELRNERGVWAETVPDHKEVAKGTMCSILRRMHEALDVPVDQLARDLASGQK